MTPLLAQLSALSGLAEEMIWQAALVFVRVGGAVALLPALGEQMLPLRLRLAATLAMTLIVAPAAGVQQAPPGFVVPLLAEAVTGLCIGLGLRLLFLALQTAGTIAAQSTSLAQMFAGTGPEPQPIVSNLLVLAGLGLFVAMDGLAHAAGLIIQSYDLIPLGRFPGAADMAAWGLAEVARTFGLAFSLAAPFVLAALLYNLALGAINRAMPQLMVSFVGAPALTLGGLALLAIATPLLLSVWQGAVASALTVPLGGQDGQ